MVAANVSASFCSHVATKGSSEAINTSGREDCGERVAQCC